MNTWELIIVAFAIGLFIRLGNRRQMAGRQRPENSRTFGVVLAVVFGVVMYAWLRSTGQHL